MRVLDEVLGFAPDGKLEKLCLAGFPNLLNEWEQNIDLGGKSFRQVFAYFAGQEGPGVAVKILQPLESIIWN